MPGSRTTWLAALWRSFLESYDADQNAAASSPLAIVGACLAESLVILVVWLLQPFPYVWIPFLFTALGGAASFTTYRHRCRGTLGAATTLIDGPLYSSGLVYVAVCAPGAAGYVAAGLFAAMLLAIQAPAYSLTALFGLAYATPVVALISIHQPPPTMQLALIGTLLVAFLVTYMTGERRRLLADKARLQGAFDTANRLADESMQAALASTLLSLGDFLHELRNAQTVVGLNLAFLREQASLREDERQALEEALTSQRAEADLVRETVQTLQHRARQRATVFLLGEVLADVHPSAGKAEVRVDRSADAFPLLGNPEHLRLILRNLVRNAEQAGAHTVVVAASVAPSARSITLSVSDDGPGVPADVRERLLDMFAFTTKPEGSGLGLYLVKRHAQLLGGSVSVHTAPAGGAEFRVALPRGDGLD